MKMARAVWSVGLLALGVGLAQSPPAHAPTFLQVSFKAVPGVAYNRLGDSTLSVTSAGQTQMLKPVQLLKLSGVLDPKDDDYWTALLPVKLNLALLPGRQVLVLSTRLFVCDKTQGLCSIQVAKQRLEVQSGRLNQVTLAAPVFRP
ncbi:hypothetical protein EHF33_15395 [Deinococcus psychrotolerans]|uniref:Uncharacterized protein n=1 Tax=Deinococcus psychrotolerans TaxID=2489213 RepID=A0A3G8YH19_9DEIO|nr:hypothetical protein [Deinococcus psychrotolerans]AZI44273.1 hypothetical protein EHF33_15395 [Deinococcus psychrotolerans]